MCVTGLAGRATHLRLRDGVAARAARGGASGRARCLVMCLRRVSSARFACRSQHEVSSQNARWAQSCPRADEGAATAARRGRDPRRGPARSCLGLYSFVLSMPAAPRERGRAAPGPSGISARLSSGRPAGAAMWAGRRACFVCKFCCAGLLLRPLQWRFAMSTGR